MDELRFDDRVAIVTGAGRGLGREYAKLLARRGASVVVNDLGVAPDGTGPSGGPAEQVTKEILDEGGSAIASSESVTTPSGAAAIVEAAQEAFGRVDILVNNAGIVISRDFAETGPDVFQAHLDVNLFGAVAMTQACWAHLRRNHGNVVNISSSAILGIDVLAAYGAAKGAVFALTRTLALSGAVDGIRVNTVLPMGATRMVDASGGAVPTPEIRAFIDVELAPSRVAPVVGFLAHESCPVTGKAFAASRGRVALVYIAETEGFRSADLTIEDVSRNLAKICDTETVFDFLNNDEMMAYVMSLETLTP
jgi:NAD(P)-dependent dehydrogenase (short-subunit alcohol dehydrogenase family)